MKTNAFTVIKILEKITFFDPFSIINFDDIRGQNCEFRCNIYLQYFNIIDTSDGPKGLSNENNILQY